MRIILFIFFLPEILKESFHNLLGKMGYKLIRNEDYKQLEYTYFQSVRVSEIHRYLSALDPQLKNMWDYIFGRANYRPDEIRDKMEQEILSKDKKWKI